MHEETHSIFIVIITLTLCLTRREWIKAIKCDQFGIDFSDNEGNEGWNCNRWTVKLGNLLF